MIARNTFVIMVTQIASGILGMFGLFAISKMWGHHAPGIMGVVWFGLSFVGAFSFITTMGFDAAHVKKVSEGKDLGKCLGTYITIKLILTAIFVICVVSSVMIWKYMHNDATFQDSTRESVIYLFIGYYALFWLAQIPIMTFNSQKKNAKSQLAIFMETVTRVALFLVIGLAGISGALIVTESGAQVIDFPARYGWPSFLQPLQSFLAMHTIGAMSLAYAFGALAMFLVGFVLMRKYPISRPDREYMRMYLMFALPMMVPITFSLLNSYLDKVFLGYYWTSVEVGYYFAVQRITSFVMFVPAAIGVVLYPTISGVHSRYRKDTGKRNRMIARLTRTSLRYISMVTVPIVFLITAFVIPLIDIVLNSSFRPGATSLQILIIYTYIGTLFIPLYYLVLGTDRPKLVAKVYIVSGVANIVLNLLFIPRNGALSFIGISGPSGAAIATLMSAAIMLLGMYIYSRRLIRRKLFETRIFLHIAAGILVGLLLWKLGGFFDPIRWYHLLALSTAGLGAYLGILFGFGEFRRRELDFFLGTMNPVSLLKYVNDEVKDRE